MIDVIQRVARLLSLLLIGAAAVTTAQSLPRKKVAAPAKTAPPLNPPSATSAATVTFAGMGMVNTEPQQLTKGDYKVQYQFDGDCYYSADLVSVDGTDRKSDLATASTVYSGETNAYGISGGSYYLKMTSGPAPGCPWRISLTKR